MYGPDIDHAQADKICVVQFVAYHSEYGDPVRRVARHLLSSQKSVGFVHEWLKPRAKAGKIGLIVARAAKFWGFSAEDECQSIIVYKGWECRRALQTATSRGGMLLRQLISN
jgi:hypothetical protein